MVNMNHLPDGHEHLSLGELLGRVSRLWKSVVDSQLLPLGLTYSRWNALLGLRRLGDSASQKALADGLEIELGSLMRTLKQLEEQGLIRRICCHNDKRARIVSLTPAGQETLKTIEATVANVRQHILKDIEEQELNQLRNSLEKITNNALSTMERFNVSSASEGKN